MFSTMLCERRARSDWAMKMPISYLTSHIIPIVDSADIDSNVFDSRVQNEKRKH